MFIRSTPRQHIYQRVTSASIRNQHLSKKKGQQNDKLLNNTSINKRQQEHVNIMFVKGEYQELCIKSRRQQLMY